MHLLAECIVLIAALAAAASVRPWRQLAPRPRMSLRAPLLALAVVLPVVWWAPSGAFAPMWQVLGAQLALLTLGWPLAVLLTTFVGAVGLVMGEGLGQVVSTLAWAAVLPMTASLALGHGVRRLTRAHPLGYIAGRGFLVPMVSVYGCGMLAQWLADRYASWGDMTGPVLMLAALLDAMITAQVVILLVTTRPRYLATWSDRLYARSRVAAPLAD